MKQPETKIIYIVYILYIESAVYNHISSICTIVCVGDHIGANIVFLFSMEFYGRSEVVGNEILICELSRNC